MTVMTGEGGVKESVLYRERPKKGPKSKKVQSKSEKVGKCGLTLTQKGNLFARTFSVIPVLLPV
jgi:hypothetical protein